MSPREALLEPLLPSDDVNDDVDENSCPQEEETVSEQEDVFSTREEVIEMLSLGLPLAVSFFCRMGMASTDSAFVGHIHDGKNEPELYLAAAVLSDMVVNVFITPPLAFNQVLNSLVSQAMGSGNPKMAGIWLQQSMFWLAITMLPCLCALFYVEPVLLSLGFSNSVAHEAGKYARYNLIWPIPNGLYQCMRFYFQAKGMPRPAMYNNLLFLGFNALLGWLFVFGGPFRWNGLGFIGAAVSLSVSRTSQSLVYFVYMFIIKKHHLDTFPDQGWSFQHHTWDRTKEFMKQSLPNIGTLLFQTTVNQATTVLVGRLGEGAIAASSALSTVAIPWSGTLSATLTAISSVRVGYHLGRGKGEAAKNSVWLVLFFITFMNLLVAAVFLPLKGPILSIATDDEKVLSIASKVVPAFLVGTYLNLVVGNITSGVFSGMGRPLLATILSFGLELPLSIGGIALYILLMHGNLLGVYWLNAIIGGFEAIVVLFLLFRSSWEECAEDARRRQEADNGDTTVAGGNDSRINQTEDDRNDEEADLEG